MSPSFEGVAFSQGLKLYIDFVLENEELEGFLYDILDILPIAKARGFFVQRAFSRRQLYATAPDSVSPEAITHSPWACSFKNGFSFFSMLGCRMLLKLIYYSVCNYSAFFRNH